MLKPFRFIPLVLVAAVIVPLRVLAQSAPPPAAGDSDDLEVPANPVTVPRATTAAPLPASPEPNPLPTATPAAPAQASDDSTLRRELQELRARVAALEQARGNERAAASEEPVSSKPVNLEKNAVSRPVPTGVRIGGYLQAQLESNQLSSDQLDQSGAPLNQDRFSVRRARLRLDRGWEYANATLELDASTTRGVNVGIRRAEGSLLYRGKNGQN
ncbi:MAG TPA: hypothetical protein VGL19_08150, partial [Polyangiaceae bacterium]